MNVLYLIIMIMGFNPQPVDHQSDFHGVNSFKIDVTASVIAVLTIP